jgi:hypothetical protein
MIKPTFPSIALLFLFYCLSAPTFAEEEASLHQVFQAAEAGKFKEAQSMMDIVLKNHPNSAKAHFVEAELLAKQGLNKPASAELSKAEQLEPALTFAKPEALQSLRSRIAGGIAGNTQPAIVHQSATTMAMPNNWLMPLLLFVGLAVLILFVMALFRRNTQSLTPNNHPAYAPNPNNNPAGNPGMGSAMGQPAAAGGGMGSGLMGNLATGAALGAGVVAGEALMHHFIDGDNNNPATKNQASDHSPWSSPDNAASTPSSSNDYDMGGNDFGVQDSSSWDDDSSGGGDDDSW